MICHFSMYYNSKSFFIVSVATAILFLIAFIITYSEKQEISNDLNKKQKEIIFYKYKIDSLQNTHLHIAFTLDSILYHYPAEYTYIMLYELRYERSLFQDTTAY